MSLDTFHESMRDGFFIWIIKNRYLLSIRIADELWYTKSKINEKEIKYHIFYIGWYDVAGIGRLYEFTFFNLLVRFGICHE